MIRQDAGMGALGDGDVVAIVGGGPAGVGCAIALRRLAQVAQRNIHVVLYEAKNFRGQVPHYNQCAGVLSPPIRAVLENQLKVPFPEHLVQRLITRYVLHSDNDAISLDGDSEPAAVVRRVQFDDYLIDEARKAGVEIVNSRVIDLEWHATGVLVYSDSESRPVAAVVGAFGLDDGTWQAFHRAVGYQQPKYLTSIVTKVHPSREFLVRMGDAIHAFLPSLPQIEFGAMTPKGNHITINIAGSDVDARSMDCFLALPPVRALLPNDAERHSHLGRENDFQYFKGKFPISLARRYYADRLATIGDAAGMIRPFKGKGVTAGCASGFCLAEWMLTRGVSQRAFADFYRLDPYCSEIRADLPYARFLRWLASFAANRGYLDVAVALARRDDALRRAMFDSVSAARPYRQIFWETISAPLVVAGLKALVSRRPTGRPPVVHDEETSAQRVRG